MMARVVHGQMTVHRHYHNEGIRNDYEVEVSISGEVEPADRSSGIMSEYVAKESIVAQTEDDNDYMLTDGEVDLAVEILEEQL